nr:MAG: UDP-glucose 4-epimerase [Candidatus Kentron sp. FM]
MASKTLIFGGTGFIGRHLCCHYTSIGRQATVISRFPDVEFLEKHTSNISSLSLDDFYGNKNEYLTQAEYLIYLASSSIPATYKNQPWMELPDNVEPAFKLFSAVVETNPSIRVVYLSSGGTIYGPGHSDPISEDARLEPISPYGYGKVVIEESLRFLGRTKNLNFAILRAANPVGIWQSNPRQGIVAVTLSAILKRRPITLFNHGRQVRDFFDADDLVSAIALAAEATDLKGKTWNIGSGKGYKICDVVALIESITKTTVEKEIVAARDVDLDYSVLDCSAAFSDLGWRSEIGLGESIRHIWNRISGSHTTR